VIELRGESAHLTVKRQLKPASTGIGGPVEYEPASTGTGAPVEYEARVDRNRGARGIRGPRRQEPGRSWNTSPRRQEPGRSWNTRPASTGAGAPVKYLVYRTRGARVIRTAQDPGRPCNTHCTGPGSPV